MDPICSLPYINRIQKNILDINPDTFDLLYNDFVERPIVLGIASGRSERSMNITCDQLTTMKNSGNRVYFNPRKNPVGGIKESMAFLEEVYPNKKILALMCSGSGKTDYVVTASKEIDEYIQEKKSEAFKVDVITSNPLSYVATIGRKYGNVLELKGSGKEDIKIEKKMDEEGMMRDAFELGKLFVLSEITKGIQKKSEAAEVRKSFKDDLQTVGKIVDHSLTSDFYTNAIDVLETRSNIFRNGYGIGDEVIYMTFIRLGHVKEALGERIYFQNPPHPRAGDFQLSVSHDGEFTHVVNTARTFVERGVKQFSVIGSENSSLEKVSNYSLKFPDNTPRGRPRMFYMWAAWAISALPLRLVERLDKRGIVLPPEILDYYHSVTE